MTEFLLKNIKIKPHFYINKKGLLQASQLFLNGRVRLETDKDLYLLQEFIFFLEENFPTYLIINNISLYHSFDGNTVNTGTLILKDHISKFGLNKFGVSDKYYDSMDTYISYLLVEYFKSRNKDIIVDELQTTTKVLVGSVISIISGGFITEDNIILPNFLMLSVDKMRDDYNPNCDTCKLAMQSLQKMLMQYTPAIYYKDGVEQPTDDDNYKMFTNNKDFELRYMPASTPVYMFDNHPTFVDIGKNIVDTLASYISMARIESFALTNSLGITTIYTVEDVINSYNLLMM